jgi:hypothetical protein
MINGANYKRGKLHHSPWHSDIRTSNQLNKCDNHEVGDTMKVLTDRVGQQANPMAAHENKIPGESFPLNECN